MYVTWSKNNYKDKCKTVNVDSFWLEKNKFWTLFIGIYLFADKFGGCSGAKSTMRWFGWFGGGGGGGGGHPGVFF